MRTFLRDLTAFGLLFLALSAGVSAAVDQATGQRTLERWEHPEVVAKLDALAAEQPVHTVFFGTSRTHRQVDPLQFDRGRAERSFNLGMWGLYPFRAWDVLDRGMALRPDADRWVIELAALDRLEANTTAPAHLRAASPHRTLAALEYARHAPGLSHRRRLRVAVDNTRLGLLRGVGAGSARALGLPLDPPEAGWSPDLRTTRGFTSLDEVALHDPLVAARRDAFLADPARSPLPPAPSDVSGRPDRFLDALLQRARALRTDGKKVVFWIPPRSPAEELPMLRLQARTLAAEGFEVHDLHDPERFPALFAPDHAFDHGHLNAAGAAALTGHLQEILP